MSVLNFWAGIATRKTPSVAHVANIAYAGKRREYFVRTVVRSGDKPGPLNTSRAKHLSTSATSVRDKTHQHHKQSLSPAPRQ